MDASSTSNEDRYILIVIPASRDTINLKENFPETWMHQALLPLFTNTVIYEIVYRLKIAFEELRDNGEVNPNLKVHLLLLADDKTESVFENEISKLKDPEFFEIEVIGKRFYPDMDLMDVIKDGVENCKLSKDEKTDAIGKNIVGIMIHFWEVILGFEFYEEIFRRFISNLNEHDKGGYSQILVYVSELSDEIKIHDNKIKYGGKLRDKNKCKLLNFLPRSTSIFSYFVYQQTDPRYSHFNPDPKRDRVGIRIGDEKNSEKYGGILIPIFFFDRNFYMDLMKYSNVNLTSSFRFVDVLRYMFIDKDDPDIIFLKRGRFLFVKYPWDYLKTFEYVNREYVLIKFKNIVNSNGFLERICNTRLGDVGFIVITSKDEVSSLDLISKQHLETLKKVIDSWDQDYELFMGYTFESYPLKYIVKDLVVDIFNELEISSVLLLPKVDNSRLNTPKDVEDLLAKIGITPDVIRDVVFKGINVIDVKQIRGGTKNEPLEIIRPSLPKVSNDDSKDDDKILGVHLAGNANIVNSYLGAGTVIMEGSLITHTILGDFVVVYPQAVVPYAIVGKHSVISSHVVFARERARGIQVPKTTKIELEVHKHKFLAGRTFVGYVDRFSALVGEHCKLMVGVRINPGRRLGHHARVRPGIAVYYNIPPYNELVDEETFRAIGGEEDE